MARLNYVEFPVGEIGPAKAFYEAVFGWSLTDFGPAYASTMTGDTDIGLQADAAEATRAPLPVIAVGRSRRGAGRSDRGGRHHRQADLRLPGRPPLSVPRPGRQRSGLPQDRLKRPGYSIRYMTSASTSPKRGWRKAPGRRPTVSKPRLSHKATARALAATTKLNCIAA